MPECSSRVAGPSTLSVSGFPIKIGKRSAASFLQTGKSLRGLVLCSSWVAVASTIFYSPMCKIPGDKVPPCPGLLPVTVARRRHPFRRS